MKSTAPSLFSAFAERERIRIRNAITEYLEVGGLFNPECMEHNKVRDLLIECREWMDCPHSGVMPNTPSALTIDNMNPPHNS